MEKGGEKENSKLGGQGSWGDFERSWDKYDQNMWSSQRIKMLFLSQYFDNYLKISKIQIPRVFVYSNLLKLLVNLYSFLKRFLRNYIGGDEHVSLGECS